MKKVFSEEIDIDVYKITHTILDIIPETKEDHELFKEWEKDNFYIERYKTKEGYRMILYTKTELNKKKGL